MLRMPYLLNQGIVYSTCGHLLRENQSSRGILRWTLDLLSIPNYAIKKGRPHGHPYGKTKEQKDHFIAHNLRRIYRKRGFEGSYDRFLKDEIFRESQLEIDRTEHPDGQGRAERFQLSNNRRGVLSITK